MKKESEVKMSYKGIILGVGMSCLVAGFAAGTLLRADISDIVHEQRSQPASVSDSSQDEVIILRKTNKEIESDKGELEGTIDSYKNLLHDLKDAGVDWRYNEKTDSYVFTFEGTASVSKLEKNLSNVRRELTGNKIQVTRYEKLVKDLERAGIKILYNGDGKGRPRLELPIGVKFPRINKYGKDRGVERRYFK